MVILWTLNILRMGRMDSQECKSRGNTFSSSLAAEKSIDPHHCENICCATMFQKITEKVIALISRDSL